MKLNIAEVWRREGVTSKSDCIQLILQIIVRLATLDGNLSTCNKQHGCTHQCVDNHTPSIVGNVFNEFDVHVSMLCRVNFTLSLVVIDHIGLYACPALDCNGSELLVQNFLAFFPQRNFAVC